MILYRVWLETWFDKQNGHNTVTNEQTALGPLPDTPFLY